MQKRTLLIALLAVLGMAMSSCGLKRAGDRSDYHFRNTTLNHNPHPYAPHARWGEQNKKRSQPRRLAKLIPRKRLNPKNGTNKEPKTLLYPNKVPTPTPTKYPTTVVPKTPTVVLPTPTVKKTPRITQFHVPRGDATVMRSKLIASAVKRIGQSGTNSVAFVIAVLKENNISIPTAGNGSAIQGMYYALKRRKQVYDKDVPKPGDLVFFHNTADNNRDNRNNDWYSLLGIVEKVEVGGTVSFVTVHFGKVQRLHMNLKSPQVRRNEKSGKVINAFLRIKRMDDPEYTQYLAGELYAGFGTLFGSSPVVSKR